MSTGSTDSIGDKAPQNVNGVIDSTSSGEESTDTDKCADENLEYFFQSDDDHETCQKEFKVANIQLRALNGWTILPYCPGPTVNVKLSLQNKIVVDPNSEYTKSRSKDARSKSFLFYWLFARGKQKKWFIIHEGK